VDGGPSPEQRAQLGAVGAAAGIGCSIVVSLIAFIGGGILLDRVAGTEPVLTLIGVALGLLAAGYQLYELAQIGRKDRPAGPLGRRLTGAGRARPPRPAVDERERDEE
jgi:F0F1-type ATP synthase assembly protein I